MNGHDEEATVFVRVKLLIKVIKERQERLEQLTYVIRSYCVQQVALYLRYQVKFSRKQAKFVRCILLHGFGLDDAIDKVHRFDGVEETLHKVCLV